MTDLDFKVQRIHHLPAGRIKAFVDLIVNDVLLIKGVRIVASPKGGIFTTMPKELGKNNRWYDRVRCLDVQLKGQIEQIVIEAYQTSLKYAE